MLKNQTPSYINKLTILFYLSVSSTALSELQIIRSFRELNLISYFDLKQLLYEAENDGFIKSKDTLNGIKYQITDQGSNTLAELEKEIDLTVREKIELYFEQNRENLEKESLFFGEYVKLGKNEFKVILRILENDAILFEVNFTAENKTEAETAIRNWTDNAVNIYKNTIGSLLFKNEESKSFDNK